jgi:asparagine synthase (glutamine-hydrolysing)
LVERWNEKWQGEDFLANSRRSGLFYVFESAHLPLYFEAADAGVTRTPIEQYHPFLDLRVLQFLMSVPTVPWKNQKHLLRTAMSGSLPETILHRPKAPLAGDPEEASGAEFPIEWQESMRRSPELEKYFSTKSGPLIPEGSGGASALWVDSRPFELASWWYCRKPLNRLSAGSDQARLNR